MSMQHTFSRIFSYREQASRSIAWGHYFLLFNILITLIISSVYVYAAPAAQSTAAFTYLMVTWLGHSSFLCAIVYLVILFPLAFIGNFHWYRVLAVILAVLGQSLLLLDVKLYLAVKAHLSLPVFSLMLGDFDFNTGLNYNFLFIALPLVAVLDLIAAKRATKALYKPQNPKFWRVLAMALCACFISSHLMHIWADAKNNDRITILSAAFPAHYPMTAKTFLAGHGWIISSKDDHQGGGAVNYPLEPLNAVPKLDAPNVLFISINGLSLREVTAGNTPFLHALSQQSLSFDHYYLPYPNARDNLFAAWYGLPRQYQAAVRRQQLSPAITDEFFRQEYIIRTIVSSRQADFDRLAAQSGLRYPQIEAVSGDFTALQKAADGINQWQSDQHYVTQVILNDLLTAGNENQGRALRLDLDRSLSNIYELLRLKQLQDRTLIIITSAQGSPLIAARGSFARDRQQVPLILRLGQQLRGQNQDLSSPFDLAPTLGIEVLGITTPAAAFAVGHDLLHLPQRGFIAADNRELTLIGRDNATIYSHDGKAWMEAQGRKLPARPNLENLIRAMSELNRFKD